MKKFRVTISFRGYGPVFINTSDDETPQSLMDKTPFEVDALIDPDQLFELIDEGDIEIEEAEEAE